MLNRGPHLLIDGAYDFVDVRDVADGLILAGEKGERGEVYILSGEQLRLVDLHKLVSAVNRKPSSIWLMPKSLAKAAANVLPFFYRLFNKVPKFTPYAYETILGNSLYTHGKADAKLGYNPRRLSTTIADTIAWLKERQSPNQIDERPTWQKKTHSANHRRVRRYWTRFCCLPGGKGL